MNFVFFLVSENGENGLDDEGADGRWGNAPPPRIYGLEPPLNDIHWLAVWHSNV